MGRNVTKEYPTVPCLAETQLPFFKRDVENGLVPPKNFKESTESYHYRLAQTYGLKEDQIAQELNN